VARAPELLQRRAQQREVGERVARALQEQHGQIDLREMIGAPGAGPARGVEREAEEREPGTPSSGASAAAREVMRPPIDLPPAISGMSPAASRPAAMAARTVASRTGSGSGRALAVLDVEELVAERGDPARGQAAAPSPP
jgi:hypothetical protein